jgi:hypothetical protein
VKAASAAFNLKMGDVGLQALRQGLSLIATYRGGAERMAADIRPAQGVRVDQHNPADPGLGQSAGNRSAHRPAPEQNDGGIQQDLLGQSGGFSVYKFDAIPPVEVVTLSRQPTDPKVLLRILDAVRNRLEIDIEYASLTGSVQQSRAVAPHSLAHSAGRWYVRSWSREHSDFRDYNLNRIIMVGDHRAPHRPGRADFPHPVLHGRASLGTAYWRVIRAGGKGCRLSRSRRRSHRKVPCRPLRDSHFFQTRPT